MVFATRAALISVYTDFKKALPGELSIQTVEIPAGATQEEHWQIAQHVNRSVDPDTAIAFDISHGPLCFPLVGLLTATFMRAARDVELRHILYAAFGIDSSLNEYELSEGKAKETPIFDLNEMLSWLEWYSAIERFDRTGDSRSLSSLLKAERKRMVRDAQEHPDRLAGVGSLRKLDGVISGLSRSLQMIRPHQTLQYLDDLPDRISSIQGLFENQPYTLIYTLLVERMGGSFSPLGVSELSATDHAAAQVETERNLVNWYSDRELWVEAITLAREWVINWVMLQLGLVDFTSLNTRRRVESVLGSEAHDYLESRKRKRKYHSIFLRQLTHTDELLRLWLEITDARNDINHAGMREKPGKPEDLQARIQSCVTAINKLPIIIDNAA
ncbi:MAG: TM1812 family CRISPR-associated protein [Anaerolineales bacterium]